MSEELDAKADSLARIACIALAESGQDVEPTLHDIAVAVAMAAPLLKLHDVPEGVHVQTEAVCKVCEKLEWAPKNVVMFPRRHSLPIKR